MLFFENQVFMIMIIYAWYKAPTPPPPPLKMGLEVKESQPCLKGWKNIARNKEINTDKTRQLAMRCMQCSLNKN